MTKETLQSNVVANFKYVRAQYGISMREMGEKLDLPQKTIGAIEEGRATSALNVYKLSRYTGISIDTLYTGLLSNQ